MNQMLMDGLRQYGNILIDELRQYGVIFSLTRTCITPALLFEFRLYENNFLLKDLHPDFTDVEKKNHSLPYFFDYKDSEERKLVYCHNMKKLLLLLGLPKYDRNEWWLFINSSRQSLKCVALHVINIYSSVTIGHSTTIKKKYEEIKRLENR